MVNNKRTKKSTVSAPKKYPAIEEKTTLIDKRILVISEKFTPNRENIDVEGLIDNTFFLMRKDTVRTSFFTTYIL